MATYLLKKSYQLKDLHETKFKDLWNDNGIFTTMWIFGKPAKILFYKKHIKNLIKSLKIYKLNKPDLEKNINKLIKKNIKNNKKYDHLLRVAINNKIISLSFRKKFKPQLNFNLKLINHKRFDPENKNLKYKTILRYLLKMNTSNSDIGLCYKGKILETGTSNLLFIKKDKIFSPINNIYEGITYKFFKKRLDKILKKDIFIKSLNEYDEIILIGSGKGVASVKTIRDKKWKRKSLKNYKFLLNLYNSEIKKSLSY